ncbi:MAG: GNAT family N-acetyltransferase [Proteobacteria bacterium]|nr:GNAT family N-acetyltransferase [Pseudomonadota bacterium]
MSLEVRPATAADLPAIRRVLVETWHATYDHIFGVEKVTEITDRWHSVEALGRQLGVADAAFLVAARDGNIVGTLYARPSSNGAITLERVYVLPSAQGSGLGRKLYDAMLACFSDVATIRLEVEPRNAPAIAFYEHLGFTRQGGGSACGGDAAAGIPHLLMVRDFVSSAPAA